MDVPSPTRPHIVFVAQQTANRSNGGLESATQIFEALHSDFQWTFVTNRRSVFTQRWSERGARIVIVPVDTTHSGLRQAWSSARLALRLAAIAWRDRPDVFHANDSFSMKALLTLPRKLRSALLFTVRGTQPADKVYGRHWRRAAKRFNRIVVLSREMADMLAPRIGADTARFVVIESIVDLKRFRPRPGPRSDRNATDEVALGNFAIFDPRKGQLGLIEQAGPLLAQSNETYTVEFFGDFEPETNSFARRCAVAAEKAPAPRFRFHGHVDDVPAAYSAIDIVVAASALEGLARAMIEGMASGVPVVSFDVCSAREMLEDTGAGIVVPPDDYEALARAVIDLGADPARRAAMGATGRAVAEQRFTADRARRAWLDLYGEVAESARDIGSGTLPTGNGVSGNARNAEGNS